MTLKYTTLALLFLLTGCTSDQSKAVVPDEALIKSEVRTAFEELVNVSKAGDLEGYFSLFDTASFTALNADGTTLHSYAEFKQLYGPQLAAIKSYKSLKFDPVYINVIDANNAVLVNEYTAEIILNSGDVISAIGAGAQVWSNKTGDWKLVHISSTQK